MKTPIVSALSLLLGLAIGWYVGHRHSEQEKNEIAHQMVDGMESSDRLAAARAVRAIGLMGAGDAKAAEQLLAGPIAHYCAVYGELVRNDELSIKVRASIQQLARTNPVVAARIAEAATNYGAKAP